MQLLPPAAGQGKPCYSNPKRLFEAARKDRSLIQPPVSHRALSRHFHGQPEKTPDFPFLMLAVNVVKPGACVGLCFPSPACDLLLDGFNRDVDADFVAHVRRVLAGVEFRALDDGVGVGADGVLLHHRMRHGLE